MKTKAMAHSRIAAALYIFLKLQVPKAIARITSMRIKASLIQNELRKTRCWRKSRGWVLAGNQAFAIENVTYVFRDVGIPSR